MFLVDDLLAAPGRAVFFLLKELARKAQEEWLDDESVKRELQEIYALLEAGTISEVEFEAREVRLVERLQEIAFAKFQESRSAAAGAPSSPAPEIDMVSPPPVLSTPGSAPAIAPPPMAFEAVAVPMALEPAQIRNTILNSDPSFGSIAATLRPLLEMVGGATRERDDSRIESGLRVQPLDDIAAVASSFGLTPAEPSSRSSAPVAPSTPFARSGQSAQPAVPMASAPAVQTAPTVLPPPSRPPAGALTINQVVDAALGGLSLLRLRVSSVTAVAHVDDGWQVTAELVERRGVPDTSDLLGVYELKLDEAGNVLQWERTRLRRRCDLGTAAR